MFKRRSKPQSATTSVLKLDTWINYIKESQLPVNLFAQFLVTLSLVT